MNAPKRAAPIGDGATRAATEVAWDAAGRARDAAGEAPGAPVDRSAAGRRGSAEGAPPGGTGPGDDAPPGATGPGHGAPPSGTGGGAPSGRNEPASADPVHPAGSAAAVASGATVPAEVPAQPAQEATPRNAATVVVADLLGDGEPLPRRPDRTTVISHGVGTAARWSLRVALIAVGAVIVGTLIGALWSIVMPIVLALLLTTVLYPPAAWLMRHRCPPAVAALGVLLVAIVVVGGVFALIAPAVVGQTPGIVSNVTSGLGQIQTWLQGPPFNLAEGQIGDALNQVIRQLQASASVIASGVLTGVGVFASGILNIVLALVLAFFFVKDGSRFLPWLTRNAGGRAGRHLANLLDASWRTLAGFFRIQALVSLIDAGLIGIGLLALGVPLALPLMVLTFFGGFIPIIGAFVAGALAVLVALVTKGLTTALIVLGIIVVVQQLEGNVLQPMLQSRGLGLHGAVVLLAVTAGGSLYGIAGAFLAVPVAAVAAEILRYMGREIDRRTGAVPEAAPVDPPGKEPGPVPS